MKGCGRRQRKIEEDGFDPQKWPSRSSYLEIRKTSPQVEESGINKIHMLNKFAYNGIKSEQIHLPKN